MTSNFFLEVRDYTLKMLYVNDIFCPVSHREEQDGYAALYEDVMKNGMKNPAIVVENTEENYHLSIRQVNTEYIKKYPHLRVFYLSMLGGNNYCASSPERFVFLIISLPHTFLATDA